MKRSINLQKRPALSADAVARAKARLLARRGPVCIECARLTKLNAEQFGHEGPTTCAACVVKQLRMSRYGY